MPLLTSTRDTRHLGIDFKFPSKLIRKIEVISQKSLKLDFCQKWQFLAKKIQDFEFSKGYCNRVNLDCWGPKTVKHKDGYTYELRILTMIDPVTGWFEYAQL